MTELAIEVEVNVTLCELLPVHVQVTVVLGATTLFRITGPHFACRTLSGRTREHH